MNVSKYRVIVVEDEPKIRRNIALKIDGLEEYEVVGTASDGVEALSVIAKCNPDVVFTDIKMPKMDGLGLIRKVRETNPEMLFVIISGYNEFEYAQTAMKMGIRDYLLKPVSRDALYECANKISENLRARTRQVMYRELLMSSSNWGDAGTKISTVSNQTFAIFLVCIGHLCASAAPLEQYELFGEIWRVTAIDRILIRLAGPEGYWAVIDERAPNQRLLIVSAEGKHREELQTMGTDIQASLAEHTGGLRVHIAALDFSVHWHEIWKRAQTVRTMMERDLVPGRSNILFPDRKPESLLSSRWDGNLLRNKVSMFNQSVQPRSLRSEFDRMFKQLEKAAYPQRMLEKATLHWIRSVHAETGVLTDEELHAEETKLYAKLAVSPSLDVFFESLWELIEKMMVVKSQYQTTLNLVEQLAKYLELNYLNDINLEELAAKFHFTPSYLSKVFKVKYGVSPLKFIIKLRVEEAKRQLAEYPQLEIGKIAEILGYPDQHYFSRLFKKTTGMSPTEYRDQHLK